MDGQKLQTKLVSLNGKTVQIEPLFSFNKRDILVDFNVKSYGRLEIGEDDQMLVENYWNERIAQNPHLFNGSKFRLASMKVSKDERTVKLCIGLTDYKHLLWTHSSEQFKLCARDKIERKEVSKDEQESQNSVLITPYVSMGLGIGAWVATSDNKLVLIKRSSRVGECPAMIDRPGGHPEPDNVEQIIEMNHDGDMTVINTLVGDEILQNSILQEVVDEIGILRTDLMSDPIVLGVVRDLKSCGRVALEFLIETSLSSQQVETVYWKGIQTEKFESDEICLVDVNDSIFDEEATTSFVVTPHCLGGINLLRMFRQQQRNSTQ